MKLFVATGLFLFSLLTSSTLFAQQPVSDTVNIKGVEVTGQKPPASVHSAVPMQQIDIQTLKSMPGLSAADALRGFSGVTIKDYGGLGGLKTVVVRSLGANHTGVFIDGAPVSDAATGQIDMSRIPLEELETIELYIGQEQMLCQTARAHASASMLGFKSVMPDFEHSNLHVKAGIKTGSFGMINPFASFYFKAGKKTIAGLSVIYNHTRGNYPFVLKNGNLPDTTLRRANAEIEAFNLNFRSETRFKDSSRFNVKIWLYGSQRGLPGAVIYYNPNSSQKLTNRDIFGNLQYSRRRNEVQLLSNLNFSDSYLRYRDPAYLNNNGGLDNRFHQQEFYLSQAISMPLRGIFNLGVAADLIVNSLQTDLYSQGNPTRFSGLESVSLQAKTQKTEATAVVLATQVFESTPENKSTSRLAWSPSFTFITRISNNPLLRLRFMFKNSFRMPTFHDLYYNLVGNDQLKPEYVNQFNLGLLFSREMGVFSVNMHTDVFANRVKNKIVAVPTQNLFVWSMRNLGKVDIRGIEIQAEFKADLVKSTELSLNLNYTHQQALDKSDPASTTYNQQIPYIPFQTFSGMLSFGKKHLTIGYNLLYTSHRYTLGENISANMLPSWWVQDIALSWQQPFKKKNFGLKAEVINLFNTQYEVIRGFPMNGRGFFVTLSINL